MSFREVPFTRNRELVSDLMLRARLFHMPVTSMCEFDVTELEARLEREKTRGRSLGMAAFMTAATSKLLGRRREVAFDEISCTLVVQRTAKSGEDILFPLVLRNTNKLTVDDIQAHIREHKRDDIESLKQFKNLQRVKNMPRLALKYFSFKARSDPEFYLKYFGTYGLSSLMAQDASAFTMSTIANTAVAFFPATIKERPVVIGGQVVPRTIMNFGFVFDHYILDGLDMMRATESMRALVEEPQHVLGAD